MFDWALNRPLGCLSVMYNYTVTMIPVRIDRYSLIKFLENKGYGSPQSQICQILNLEFSKQSTD